MQNQGFTLIELIAVILLISILAVSVAPKFDSTDGYEAHTHRAQLIAALRLTQQRAMQQTSQADDYCHQIVFDNDYPRYGIPDRTDCDVMIFPGTIENWEPDATGYLVDSRYQITFNIDGQSNPQAVGFDWMGRPTKDCLNGCVINVAHPTSTSLKITIEKEGYIHAFDLP
ncbi:type II secretion system GspH family protein [Colwellia sp. E2M01]|nr:type II secretion system protein [Colwellia sp. E2M01]MBU2870302.1 type II secretion system GspH family protein [Colwellia sp. E2M01]